MRMRQKYISRIWTLTILLRIGPCAGTLSVPGLDDIEYVSLGDINLGVLAYMHYPGDDNWCSSVPLGSMAAVAEMIHFTFLQINARDDLLPNISLGFVMKDDCLSDLKSLARATQLVSTPDTCGPGGTSTTQERRVVGLIGPGTSRQCVMVASFAGLFQLPVLAMKATSDELRDKTRFEYFMRLVPPDFYQTRAIVDVLRHFGWRYVSLVYSEGSYGENAAKQIENGIRHTDICIAFSHRISSQADDDEFTDLAAGLINNRNAHVVVTFILYSAQFRVLMQKLHGAGGADSFLFVGGDSMGAKLREHRHHGSLHITYASYSVPGALEFIKSQPCYGSANPWAAAWCDHNFACYRHDIYCPDDMTFGYNDTQDFRDIWYSADWGDAVYVYAHALHDLISSRCPLAFADKGVLRDCITGPLLLGYMKNVTFLGNIGHIEFTEHGDRKGEYVIAQIQVPVNGQPTSVNVGRWSMLTDSLTIDEDKLTWKAPKEDWGLWNNTDEVPESVCSKPCKAREYPQRLELPCCWECRKCRENERLLENHTGCETCDPFTWPDDVVVTRCVELEPVYLQPLSAVGLTLLCLTSTVLVFSAVTSAIIIKHSKRKLIKACSRDLSLVILFGTLTACLVSFVFVLRPAASVCVVRSFGFHLAISLIYAPLAVKSVRIYRIFDAGRKGNTRPALTSNKIQMIFTLAILAVQVCFSTFCCFSKDFAGTPHIKLN